MSVRIWRVLFNQKVFSAVNIKSCVLNSSKLVSQSTLGNVAQDGKVPKEISPFTNEERQYCQNFMEKQLSLPVQWESLEHKLKVMKSTNFRSAIFRSCQVLNKGDLALDYCQYIINKGEKLSFTETCLLLKILAKCKSDFGKHDKLIKKIFEELPLTILDLEIIAKEAMNVFCQSPSCFKELLNKYKEGKIHSVGIEKLIATAFDMNAPELAWNIANEKPESFTYSVVESYLKFCIRMAEQNTFSLDMINNLINFSKTYSVMLKCNSLYDYFNQLTTILNKSGTLDNLWVVNKCELLNKGSCSSCKYKFKQETVTAEELEELKKNFFNKVMICYNINMKTTPKELKTFLNFLENCKPYDIVVDALNLFSGSNYKKLSGLKILNFFENQGMRILLIGKSHFKNSKIYNEVKKKLQIFLTRNDSLDDLFCLYAAMHQGLNTYFCSADFLRDHAKYFDDNTLNILFRKWQITHQYLIQVPGLKVLPPRCHSDISQSSIVLDGNNKVKEYCWHLAYFKRNQNFRIETPAEWICLRAISEQQRM